MPRRALSPNEKYAALVAAAGYLPLTLTGEDYLELLPVAVARRSTPTASASTTAPTTAPTWAPWRLQHSGVTASAGSGRCTTTPMTSRRCSCAPRTDGSPSPWTHLPMVVGAVRRLHLAPRPRLAAETGRDDTNETEVARVLDELLTRAQAGPVDKASDRVAARTRVAAAAHRPPSSATKPSENGSRDRRTPATASWPTVIPFGVFDADAEAERWL